MEIASGEALVSQRREQLQSGWKTLFLLKCCEMLGAEGVMRKQRYDTSDLLWSVGYIGGRDLPA